MDSIPELYQFSFSHYNEKARWALDYKGIPHRRRSLLPGAHIPIALWHTHNKQLPFLRVGGRTIAGSAAIIDYLEQVHPRHSLYPRALKERSQALELQAWFDNEVGAAVRRAFFYAMLQDNTFTARSLTLGRGPMLTRAYRLGLPLLKPLLKADMRITRKAAEAGRAITRQALDRIAETAGEKGYLIGDRFTVADLTAASLLMITVFPPELQFALPEPRPAGVQNWLEHWADHPGVAWISNTFRRHRGSSQQVSA